MKKRLLCCLLSLCMVGTMFPVSTLASDDAVDVTEMNNTADDDFFEGTIELPDKEIIDDSTSVFTDNGFPEIDDSEDDQLDAEIIEGEERSDLVPVNSDNHLTVVDGSGNTIESIETETYTLENDQMNIVSQNEEIISGSAYTDPYDWDSDDVISAASVDAYSYGNTIYLSTKGYGGQLSYQEKLLYDLLTNNYVGSNGYALSNVSSSIVFTPDEDSFYADTTDELLNSIFRAYWAFVYDHPTVFWAGSLNLSYSTKRNDSGYILVNATLNIQESYSGAMSQISNYNNGLQYAVDAIYQSSVAKIRENTATSSYRFIFYREIHDWVCNTLVYNDNAYANSGVSSYKYAYSSGSVFTGNPNVVCEGYGETFKVLCDQMRYTHGIQLYCAEIVGSSPGKKAHMWNYVQMEDMKWYAVDTTWDDQPDIVHTYFLCGALSDGFDASFSEEHLESSAFPLGTNHPLVFPTLTSNRFYVAARISDTRYDSITFNYNSTVSDMRTYYGLTFDLNWLNQDSSIYNHDLAIASLALVMATFVDEGDYLRIGYADRNIKGLLSEIGFDTIGGYEAIGMDQADDPSAGTIGTVISRRIYNGETYYVISLRGGGYGTGGWVGDFDVGQSGRHVGFYKAALNAQINFLKYIGDHKIDFDKDHSHVWITGFSRSAATANLLSERLRDMFDSDKIFTYTFATPNNQDVETARQYNNIFNIVNPIDIVPRVPFENWNMYKHGNTLRLPQYQTVTNSSLWDAFFDRFEELSGREYAARKKQEKVVSYLTDLLTDCFNREQFYNQMQFALQDMIRGDKSSFDFLFGNITTIEDIKTMAKTLKWRQLINTLSAAVAQRSVLYGKDDPYVKFLRKIVGVVSKAAAEGVNHSLDKIDIFQIINEDEDMINAQVLALLLDITKDPFASHLFMQHWSETYMAWLNVIDPSEFLRGGNFRSVVVRCPVDIEVYDANNNLVGRTVCKDVEIIDEETGESYTVTVSTVDEDVTTIDMTVFGDEKMITLPDDQEYSVKVITNENYTDGDTMDYSVTGYVNGIPVKNIAFNQIELSNDSLYEGTVAANDVSGCTLSADGSDENLAFTITIIAETAHVSYDGNGAMGTGFSAEVVTEDTYLLEENMFTAPEGQEFAGWLINGEEYQPGMAYIPSGDTLALAIWRDIPEKAEDITGYLTNDITWTLTGNGTLGLSGKGAIPDFDGTDGAPWYQYRESITSLCIDDDITIIGAYAFAGLNHLTSVTIDEAVDEIHGSAFRGCVSLQEMTLPFVGNNRNAEGTEGVFGAIFGTSNDGINQYYKVEGTSAFSIGFDIPQSLYKVTITDATRLSLGAFHNCSFLTELNLNEGIKNIGEYALAGCTGLTRIVLPSTVTFISDRVLSGASGLQSLTLPFVGQTRDSEGDKSSVLGHLFDFSDEGITQFVSIDGNQATGYKFDIPSSLTRVTLTNTGKISFGAFSGCENLTEVSFSKDAININDFAFYNCTGLSDVFYNGEEEDWSEVSIGGYNSPLYSATIHVMGYVKPRVAVSFDSNGGDGEMLTIYAIQNEETELPQCQFTAPEGMKFKAWEIKKEEYGTGETYIFVKDTILKALWTELSIDNFENVLILPNSLVKIEAEAFDGLSLVEAVRIPDSVTEIEDDAFGDGDIVIIANEGSFAIDWAKKNNVGFIEERTSEEK